MFAEIQTQMLGAVISFTQLQTQTKRNHYLTWHSCFPAQSLLWVFSLEKAEEWELIKAPEALDEEMLCRCVQWLRFVSQSFFSFFLNKKKSVFLDVFERVTNLKCVCISWSAFRYQLWRLTMWWRVSIDCGMCGCTADKACALLIEEINSLLVSSFDWLL